MNEREYGFIEVVGRSGGMNQIGWEGAIADNECTMIYNMGTTINGEWKKRKGYFLRKQFDVSTTAEVAKLHWHTDEVTDQADATTWCETGDEITAASSGALNVTSVYAGPDWSLDGETVGTIYTTDQYGAIGIKSSFNLNATAGKMTFWFKTALNQGDTTSTVPPPTPMSDDYQPDKYVYLFYGGANFSIGVNPGGALFWRYGSGASEYLYLGTYRYGTWYKMDIRWDNDAGGTIYPTRYEARIDGVLIASNDTGPVTNTLDADVFFLNTAANGTDSPGHYITDIYGGSGGNYGTRGAYTVRTSVALIKTWDAASAVVVPPKITGIHNNTSQQRALITAGTTGKIFYSPSWTLATGVHALANARTSGVECQGNFYIVDGTTTMFYVIGTATAVTSYTLPETAKWIEEYHGHLCIAGLGTSGVYSVRLSTVDDFVTSSAVSWPSTNQIFKCRDVVRGIKSFDGSLIVGTRSTIEAISGYLPQDFTKTIVANGASCASHWSMVEVPFMDGTTSGLIWAGYDGIYMLMSGQVSKISWPIQKFWDSLSMVEIEDAHAVDSRTTGEYLLAVSDGSSTDNTHIIVYNYRTGAWDIREYANNMDVLGKYYRSGKEILLGGDSSGALYELGLTDADNGRPIEGYIQTKWHDGGLPDQDKDFRRLYVWIEAANDFDVEVGWSTNYEEATTPASIVVGTDGNDYTCILDHEPSVVVGTDNNDYYCTDEHTAAAANKPITGASYASFWTATGTVGRGTAWTADAIYAANDDMKPITGAQYALYWVPRNSVGIGTTWSASAGYSAETVSMQSSEYVNTNPGSTKFGVAVFGTDTFTGANATRVYGIDLVNARGRSIRFLFRTKNEDEPFSIRGYKVWFTYIPEFPA